MTTEKSPTWVDSLTARRPILGEQMGVPETTLNKIFRKRAEQNGDCVQYVLADDTPVTLAQFYKLCRQVAKSILTFGLEPYDGVAIHGFNSIEWFAADVGTNLAACIPAGIYTTNKPDIVAYILNDYNARLIFVDDAAALRKCLSVRSRCPNLTKIIVWGDFDPEEFVADAEHFLGWDDFLALGDGVSDDDVDTRMDLPTPESTCKLIYTSGTTGPPKAVMISHDNIVFTAQYFGSIVDVGLNDRLVSYLPCSHIAANTIDICGAILHNFTVYLADPDALRGSLVHTLRKARPTVFVAVPRVFEKMHERLLLVGSQNGPIKRALATWAKDVGRRASLNRDEGDEIMPWGYQLANFLVFKNVSKALGLDAARIIINTSAPLQKTTDEYFKSLNFRIVDLYGMSEATGPLIFNYPDYRPGTSGKVLPGIDVKMVNKLADGEGELCFRGRNMFMGYLNNPEESARTMDDEGFIHSGDLGRIDTDGFVSITGRAKELIVTAGGENVAPILVETTLITAMPAISRAFAIGDKRKFVSALLIPHMDGEGKLIGPAAAVNPDVRTVQDAVNDAAWQKYLNAGVKEANEDAISNAARVKKFRIITKDFSVEGEELTPSMKVKRKVVEQKYHDIIESMYES